MSFKIFILLGLVAFASANVQNDVTLNDSRDLIVDAVLALVKNLLKVVEQLVAQLTNVIQDLLTKIMTTADKILQDLTLTIAELLGGILGSAVQGVGEASSAGIDVAQCGVDRLDEIANLPFELINNATKCIEGVKAPVLQLIEEAKAELIEIAKIPNDVVASVGECGILNILCYTKLGNLIKKLLVDLPKRVHNLIDKLSKAVTLALHDMLGCGTGTVLQTLHNAVTTVKEIIKCVDHLCQLVGVTCFPPTTTSTLLLA